MLRCTAAAARTTSWPATRAQPLSGRDSVVRIRTAVVLPAPFGPSTPRMDPAGTWRSMPARATVWPYRLVSPSASIIRELTGASTYLSTSKDPTGTKEITVPYLLSSKITVMPRRSAATAGRPLSGTGAGTGRYPDEGDTRERILDIAMDLFIEQGYDKTSLRQIADRLGFTQAAIDYHFAAKQDILVALHLRLHELARPAFEQLEEQAGPAGWAVVLRGLVDTTLANRKLF